MKLTAGVLLVAGWLLVLSSLEMLTVGVSRNAFVAAGIGVQALGLALAIRAHLPVKTGRTRTER